jgi:hypothetical protein
MDICDEGGEGSKKERVGITSVGNARVEMEADLGNGHLWILTKTNKFRLRCAVAVCT